MLSDQGKQFMSTLFKDICVYLKTNKINTTAYHPQCNGLTEKFNGTLCQTLLMYVDEKQSNWDEFINPALFAYRTSVQETTKIAPCDIIYGHEVRFPSEFENIRSINDAQAVKDLKNKWRLAFELRELKK